MITRSSEIHFNCCNQQAARLAPPQLQRSDHPRCEGAKASLTGLPRAARAGTETQYPWGDKIKLNGNPMANCAGCGSQWDNKQTAPVGLFACEPIRFLRHGRQRLGVDGGLLGTRTTKERRLTARHGPAAIAVAASTAAVPGTTFQSTCARRTAAGSPPPSVPQPRVPDRPIARQLKIHPPTRKM